MEKVIIRPIEQKDEARIAQVIRHSLELNKADKPGTVYHDATTDHLWELFKNTGSVYFVAEAGGEVVGGCGLYPTDGLAAGTVELVKLYVDEKALGKGIGKMLFTRSLEAAGAMGYEKVYIETMPELTKAIPMYEKWGFRYLPAPMGNSGHNGCGIWMLKEL